MYVCMYMYVHTCVCVLVAPGPPAPGAEPPLPVGWEWGPLQEDPSPALTLQARLQRLLRRAPGAAVCREEPDGGPSARPTGAPGTSPTGRHRRAVRHPGATTKAGHGARRVLCTSRPRFLVACADVCAGRSVHTVAPDAQPPSWGWSSSQLPGPQASLLCPPVTRPRKQQRFVCVSVWVSNKK